MGGLGLIARRRAMASSPTEETIERVKFNNSVINTGIVATENHSLEMVVEDVRFINNMHYFGTLASSGYGFTMTLYAAKYYFGANGLEKNGGKWIAGQKKVIRYNWGEKNNVYINGELIGSYDNVGNLRSTNLLIGQRDNNRSLTSYLYSFRLIDKTTGEDVIRLSPAKQDNVVGLYDEVNGIFFTSEGGELTIE